MNTLLIVLAILLVTGAMSAAVLGNWGCHQRWEYVPRGVVGAVVLLCMLLSILD